MKEKLNIFENIYFYFKSIDISCNCVLNTEILIVMLFSILLVVIFYNN